MSIDTLQKQQEQKRLAYIDMAKAFALFLVILFHKQEVQQTMLQRFGAAFHMPIFFFLFGMASSGGAKLNTLRDGIVRRFRSMMVPYFLWAFIYLRTWKISLTSIVFLLYGSHATIRASGTNSVLWFLPAMFFAACVFDLVTFCGAKKESNKKRAWLYTGAIAAAALLSFAVGKLIPLIPLVSKAHSPLNMDVALSGFCFLMAGYLLKDWIHKVLDKSNGVLMLLSAAFCLLTVLLARWNPVRVIMAMGVYGNFLLFLAGGLTGSIGITLLMAVFERIMKSASRPIAWIGRHSMFIFASHHIIFNLLDQCYELLGISQPGTMAEIVLYSILTMALCSSCCAVTVPFAPVLEGK